MTTERMVGLAKARVVFADYELLMRDFPQLAEPVARKRAPRVTATAPSPSAADRARIDAWLVRHAAVMSEPQAMQTAVNEPVPRSGSTVVAHRPPHYGRSAVIEVCGDDGVSGLLDVKGVGVRPGTNPTPTVHGHGLLSLDLALQELLNQLLVDTVFRHARVEHGAVPVYAVLDAGFDAREYWTGHGLIRPCAVLVRRAHRREPGGRELPTRGSVKQFVLAEIEMLLRRYGITSVGPWSTATIRRDERGVIDAWLEGEPVTGYSQHQLGAIWTAGGAGRWTRFEGINIQSAAGMAGGRSLDLVDFGHFNVRASFEYPVVSLVDDRPLRWGGVLLPDDAAYVQPHPRVRAPFALWGYQTIRPATARMHRLPTDFRLARSLDLAMMLATGWRRGTMDSREICGAIRSHMTASVNAWSPVTPGGRRIPLQPIGSPASSISATLPGTV